MKSRMRKCLLSKMQTHGDQHVSVTRIFEPGHGFQTCAAQSHHCKVQNDSLQSTSYGVLEPSRPLILPSHNSCLDDFLYCFPLKADLQN